jgi:hypothetical protein
MVVTDGSDSGDGSDTRVAVVVTALAVVVTNKQTNTCCNGQEVAGFTFFICNNIFCFSVYLEL